MRRLLVASFLLAGLSAGLGFAPLAAGEKKAPKEAPKEVPKESPKETAKAPAPPPQDCTLTLEEFMKKRVQATLRDKSLSEEEKATKLKGFFGAILTLAPDPSWNEGTTSWKKITQDALDSGAYGRSCRSCHTAFEEKYKKAHHTTKICVDPSLLK